jgi:hypothetical protein
VIRRHILWVETGVGRGTDATREKNPKKKGEEKKKKKISLLIIESCVYAGVIKRAAMRIEERVSGDFISPSPPSLEVTARHCKHERIFPLLFFFYFYFYFYFIFFSASSSSPGTRRVDVRIGRP